MTATDHVMSSEAPIFRPLRIAMAVSRDRMLSVCLSPSGGTAGGVADTAFEASGVV
jgi:hypothetical protein